MSKPSFEELAQPYLDRPEVCQMNDYTQHGSTTTLAHSIMVARTSLRLARRWGWRIDERDLVAGAMLHDFYLYDWHDRSTSKPNHATKHPLYAAENAVALLGVNTHVKAIIESHMWPLPPTRIPRSKEAWLVCVADKWCSLKETLRGRVPSSCTQAPLPQRVTSRAQASRPQKACAQTPHPQAHKATPGNIAPSPTRSAHGQAQRKAGSLQ